MKKAFTGKRKVLTLGIVFAIAIVGIVAIFMVKQPDESKKQVEPTGQELPDEVRSEIERFLIEPEIHMTRWSVDAAEQRVDIFVWKLTPENERLNGKVIDGWTINITFDAELMKEEEKINAEIERLAEMPEMQIAGWSVGITPGTGDKKVEIFVYSLTPENQELDGKTIDGWTIHVYESLTPPKENRTGR